MNRSPEQYSVYRLNSDTWNHEMHGVIKQVVETGHDSIYFGQNMLGIKGLKVINSLNIAIPDDIAVISFDNPEVFEFSNPPVTCYEQPLDVLAHKALDYLIRMLEGKKVCSSSCEKFKGSLIIRDSC